MDNFGPKIIFIYVICRILQTKIDILYGELLAYTIYNQNGFWDYLIDIFFVNDDRTKTLMLGLA